MNKRTKEDEKKMGKEEDNMKNKEQFLRRKRKSRGSRRVEKIIETPKEIVHLSIYLY